MEYSVKLEPEVNILELGEKCSDVCTFTTKRHIRQVHEIIEFMCDKSCIPKKIRSVWCLLFGRKIFREAYYGEAFRCKIGMW